MGFASQKASLVDWDVYGPTVENFTEVWVEASHKDEFL
jgi:hypothetical protein